MPFYDANAASLAAYVVRRATRWDVLMACSVLQCVLPVLFVVAHAGLRHRWRRTAVRPTRLAVASALGVVFQAVVGPITLLAGHEHMPCWLHTILGLLAAPLCATSALMGVVAFTLSKRVGRARLNAGTRFLSAEDAATPATLVADKSVVWKLRAVAHAFVAATRRDPDLSELPASIPMLRYLMSVEGHVVTFTVYIGTNLLIALAFVVAYPAIRAGCNGCLFSVPELFTIGAQILVPISYCVVVAYQARDERDPFGFISEARALLVVATFALVFFALSSTSTSFIPSTSKFDFYIFLSLTLAAFVAVQTVVQLWLGYRAECRERKFALYRNGLGLGLGTGMGMGSSAMGGGGALVSSGGSAHLGAFSSGSGGANTSTTSLSNVGGGGGGQGGSSSNWRGSGKAHASTLASVHETEPQASSSGGGSRSSAPRSSAGVALPFTTAGASHSAKTGSNLASPPASPRVGSALGTVAAAAAPRGSNLTSVSSTTNPNAAERYGHIHTLRQVLADAELRPKFEEFLVDEQSVELLLFYRAASEWQASYFDVAETANYARAKHICATFLARGSEFQVNVSGKLEAAVEAELRDKPGTARYDLFDDLVQEVTVMLTHGPVRRFMMRVRRVEDALGTGLQRVFRKKQDIGNVSVVYDT